MNYESFVEEILNLSDKVKILNLGSSVLNRTLFGCFFNFGSCYNVLIHGAIHAREHLTCDLICYLMKVADKNYNKFYGKLPNILFVPMVNPDGVQLCTNGISSVQEKQYKISLLKINKSLDFSLFKANANGVDLNNNFNANFGGDPRYKTVPFSHGYCGKRFESEPESRMLAQTARIMNPVFTISYHAKGEEIYYNFNLNSKKKKYHYVVAKFFGQTLKYKVKGEQGLSCGGFKDYCIDKLKIPSLTIEIGQDKLIHPLKQSCLKQIIKRHKNFYKCLKRAYKFIIINKNKF